MASTGRPVAKQYARESASNPMIGPHSPTNGVDALRRRMDQRIISHHSTSARTAAAITTSATSRTAARRAADGRVAPEITTETLRPQLEQSQLIVLPGASPRRRGNRTDVPQFGQGARMGSAGNGSTIPSPTRSHGSVLNDHAEQ